MLCWNKILWLGVSRHLAILSVLYFCIRSLSTVKICLWHRLQVISEQRDSLNNVNWIIFRYKTHEESRAERRNYFTEKEIPIHAPVAPPRVKKDNKSRQSVREIRYKYTRWLPFSVTRLGDFLHFGQPFKAGGNNYFTQITHIVWQIL